MSSTKRTTTRTDRQSVRALGAAAVLLATLGGALVMGGCRGDRFEGRPRQFFPDMDDSPKFKPQTKSELFEDGRTMRRPVEGTVAFSAYSRTDAGDRAHLLREDDAFYRGVNAQGEYIAMIPPSVKVDAKLLTRGQERYNIYCAVCHNYDGHGKGMVGEQWSYPLPNFHDAKYKHGYTETVEDPQTKAKKTVEGKTGKDGYLFYVARNGVENGAKMPGYGHALSYEDTWAIVAYMRVLQTTEDGKLNIDVPADKRGDVQKLIDDAKRKWEEAQRAAEAEAARKAAEAAQKNQQNTTPEKKP